METIYAAFNSLQAANAAVERLQTVGFTQSSIRYAGDATFRAPPSSINRDTGFLSSLENLFAKWSGASNAFPSPLFEKTLLCGGSVLAVQTETPIERRTAEEVFRNTGAIDTERYEGPLTTPRAWDMGQAITGRSDVDAGDRPVAVGGLPLHRCLRAAERSRADVPDNLYGPTAVALGAAVSEADLKPFAPGDFEIRQLTEVLTVKKVPRIVEEITVNKSVTTYSETIQDSLRGTSVQIERIPAPS